MIAYGPGDSKLDHTLEEHLDIREYLASIEVLREALKWLRRIHKRDKTQ
jgi:LysW-gamma-L-lysine carboxypeptidase